MSNQPHFPALENPERATGKPVLPTRQSSATTPEHHRQKTGGVPRTELVQIELLDPNPFQPRKVFEESAIMDLAASIKDHGLIHPIQICRNGPSGRFVIVSGERRVLAASRLGWTVIPGFDLGVVSRTDLIALALTENLARTNLSPFEVAETYRSFLENVGTAVELAQMTRRDADTIRRYIALLELPKEVIDSAMKAKLSFRRLRAVCALPTAAAQIAAVRDFANDDPRKPHRLPTGRQPKPAALNKTSPTEAPTEFPGRFQRTCIVSNADKAPQKLKITIEGKRKHIEPGELRQALAELIAKTYGESISPAQAARRLVAELDAPNSPPPDRGPVCKW